jgi:hypothetical protein
MKCPKCGYVSFDYNLSCPKCGKDISSEQERLNLPAFKPNPLSLLGTLTGEAGEPSVELSDAESTNLSFSHEAVQTFDEPSLADTGGGGIDVSDDLGLTLEVDEPKPAKDTGEFDLDLDTGDKALSDFQLDESPGDALSQESDSLILEQGTIDQEAVFGGGGETASEGEKEEEEIDFSSLELSDQEGAEEKGEIELKLDDLQIDDAGDLGPGEKASAASETEKPIDIDEISMDEIPLNEELLQEDGGKESARKGKAEEPLEVSADDGEAIDLDDLGLDIEVEEEPNQT